MGLLALVLLLLLLAGVIITGGELTKRAVEVYNSVSQNTCSLENLPNSYSHTLCGGLLCGGGPQSSRRKRCLKFDANTYTFSLTDLNLKKWSVSSLCWPVDNEGILLLGGLHNARCRTEYVKADASDSCESFHLRHPAMLVRNRGFFSFYFLIPFQRQLRDRPGLPLCYNWWGR